MNFLRRSESLSEAVFLIVFVNGKLSPLESLGEMSLLDFCDALRGIITEHNLNTYNKGHSDGFEEGYRKGYSDNASSCFDYLDPDD